jgi:hypothetical protein
MKQDDPKSLDLMMDMLTVEKDGKSSKEDFRAKMSREINETTWCTCHGNNNCRNDRRRTNEFFF